MSGSYSGPKNRSETNYKPFCYDSRATTTTEKRCSQIQIESVALLFGTLENHIYLYGLPSYIASTDHQPLLSLYEMTKTDISARILRHKLRMQGYSYHLIYEPGAHNLTDYMSRHPKASEKEIDGLQVVERQLELITNALIHSDLPNSVTTDDLVHATRQDATLQLLTKAVQKAFIAPTEKQLQSINQFFKNCQLKTRVLYLKRTVL